MSDICFGFIEFNINIENAIESYPITRQMVISALSQDIYLGLWKNMQGSLRTVLDEIRKTSDSNSKNILEFSLADSPIAPDIGLGISDFIRKYQVNNNTQLDINLYLFLKELWTKPYIQKIIIVFAWDFENYEDLKRHTIKNIDEMFSTLYCDYIKTNGEMNSLFHLSKRLS